VAEGLCATCAKPAAIKSNGKTARYCPLHLAAQREIARRNKGCKLRWTNASSYVAAAEFHKRKAIKKGQYKSDERIIRDLTKEAARQARKRFKS
jgi:hypothetical protein